MEAADRLALLIAEYKTLDRNRDQARLREIFASALQHGQAG